MQFTCTGLSHTFRLTFSETLTAFISNSFSGIVTFTPTALDKRLYNSTGEYTVCEETVR